VPLDLAAKLDSTADFESGSKWGDIEFPVPFGRTPSKEEAYIEELDSKTGASLKLTILNPEGRVWTMVAGGGASVIFADTITDLGFMKEMANYGEYSGDPNEEFTYLYAKTIIDLMTRNKNPQGKFLLIGGGIANFTDVANTFKGIVKALEEYRNKLQENKVKIYVRRGGPNYREGLEKMRALGEKLGIPIEVYGPETHMTKIVSLALKGEN
jgi:succinyl-CoA synthetase beta subunit